LARQRNVRGSGWESEEMNFDDETIYLNKIKQLEAKLAIAVEALEFYAVEEKWTANKIPLGNGTYFVYPSFGLNSSIARQALAKLKDSDENLAPTTK
jgi:hypothetical protein